jgi:hypothetical protein
MSATNASLLMSFLRIDGLVRQHRPPSPGAFAVYRTSIVGLPPAGVNCAGHLRPVLGAVERQKTELCE